MESVLATVSGYNGAERFHLIKLIAQSGASYVGMMNQSITHLVCWKHEGRKYELAKEFGTFIVNHRWVEECVKQGRRVSEKPYLLQSGKEVGRLVLDVLCSEGRFSTLPSYQPDSNKLSEAPDLDIVHELDTCFPGDHWFQNKSMASECGPSNSKSRKNNKKEGKHSDPFYFTSRHYHKHDIYEVEDEEQFSPSTLLETEKKKSIVLPESHRKGRRLVKKNVIDLDCEKEQFSASTLLETEKKTSIVLPESHRKGRRLVKKNVIDLDCGKESRPISVADKLDRLTTQTNGSNKKDKKRLRHGVISNVDFVVCDEDEENKIRSSQNMDPIDAPDDSNIHSEAANVNEKGIFTRPVETNDLSCVICWTNYSLTRGVLPCGHRFCFSCIENWADEMVKRGRASTCPLCKAGFSSITKVDDASSSDQKIFSQTIPFSSSIKDIFILPRDEIRPFGHQTEPNPACTECSFREPVDLLVKCHLCHVRCVHSYCLDPPLLPWTCIHCKDLQMMYRYLY